MITTIFILLMSCSSGTGTSNNINVTTRISEIVTSAKTNAQITKSEFDELSELISTFSNTVRGVFRPFDELDENVANPFLGVRGVDEDNIRLEQTIQQLQNDINLDPAKEAAFAQIVGLTIRFYLNAKEVDLTTVNENEEDPTSEILEKERQYFDLVQNYKIMANIN